MLQRSGGRQPAAGTEPRFPGALVAGIAAAFVWVSVRGEQQEEEEEEGCFGQVSGSASSRLLSAPALCRGPPSSANPSPADSLVIAFPERERTNPGSLRPAIPWHRQRGDNPAALYLDGSDTADGPGSAGSPWMQHFGALRRPTRRP